MAFRNSDLGRVHGVFVPIEQCETHLASGWEIVDDLAGDAGARDLVMMRQPITAMEAAE